MDYNPHLKNWQRPDPNKSAGKGNIEKPGEGENFVHQTRGTPPTDYENKLGQALEEIYSENIKELVDVVRRLNEMGIQTLKGETWTEEEFRLEMRRLGA